MSQRSGDVGPTAASIRNWGPWYQVFIVAEMGEIAPAETDADIYKYICSFGNTCATATLTNGFPKAVGSTVSQLLALHTATAIWQDGPSPGGDPVIVEIARRQKVDTDCDDDGVTDPALDPAEAALDLQHLDWRSDTNVVTGRYLISTNVGNTSPVCRDTGLGTLAIQGDLHACYTYKVDPTNGQLDRVRCNDDSGLVTFVWPNAEAMTSPGGLEDHPAFAFKNGARVVLTSNRPAGTGNDVVEFHFPDAAAPPLEPKFGINVGGDVTGGNYPDLMGSRSRAATRCTPPTKRSVAPSSGSLAVRRPAPARAAPTGR